MSTHRRHILTIRCPDRKGIVAAVAAFLLRQDASITESQQCDDNGIFFIRLVFECAADCTDPAGSFHEGFASIAASFRMDWSLHAMDKPQKILIAVSKFGHCLHDLLRRWKAGLLPVEISGVVSNHDDLRSFVEWNGIPFHHFPVNRDSKEAQEDRILDLFAGTSSELLVLARYMQILSPRLCAILAGRCINIHHSFLPSFKGAKPYHQAHERGVKIIGATAHYVTTDLDEGPIIEQDILRIDHNSSAERLVELGQDVESAVLARAVRWHAEHRILLNDRKTIVFRN